MITIDHFYVTVTDLDEAINFYQEILQRKVTHREGNRWADFDDDNGQVYFGIYNVSEDNEKFTAGNSPTLCLKTDNIVAERSRILTSNPKTMSDITTLTQPSAYHYFQFTDEWGNSWEVAEYNY